jgi:hypothetical protein
MIIAGKESLSNTPDDERKGHRMLIFGHMEKPGLSLTGVWI